MPAKVDYSGTKKGKLQILEKLPQPPYTRAQYLCRCDCGNDAIVSGSSLATGKAKSCGCLVRKHGFARKERLYNIWVGMRQRCRDKKSKDYENYGGRGITVCTEWENDYIVFKSWALSNGYDDSLSIDRVDHDGGYSPNNCRWTTFLVQNNNTRGNTLITFNNETHTIAEWARQLNIPYKLMKSRIHNNWSFERIFAHAKEQVV